MTLKEQYIEKLIQKVSPYEHAPYRFTNAQSLSIRDLKQIVHAFEELEERIRVLEKSPRTPCGKNSCTLCDEYPCFTYFGDDGS